MLTGAILAGGRSRRFGSNKALISVGGARLIDRVIDSIQTICDPILLIANDLKPYYDVRAALVKDVIPHQGPLGAIYTALLFSPHEWVFVKATDMPYINLNVARKMYELTANCDGVAPVLDGRYEPLFALYSRRCLPAIAEILQSKERKVTSFYRKVKIRALQEAEWRAIDEEGRSFLNINTLEDWKKLPWN